MNRTPPEIKKYLNTIQGTGAYLVYASIEESAVSRLPAERFRVAASVDGESESNEFTVAVASHQPAPAGKRAVTFMTRTDVRVVVQVSNQRRGLRAVGPVGA